MPSFRSAGDPLPPTGPDPAADPAASGAAASDAPPPKAAAGVGLPSGPVVPAGSPGTWPLPPGPRRLPPLTALRAFEAAARLGSFRAAAEELSVTHSAISHQIRELELHFGLPLFHRHGRGVALTDIGGLYAAPLRQAFDGMARATDMVRRAAGPPTLRVQVYVTVAMRWLIPRLSRFNAAHPDVTIHLYTSFREWEFDLTRADVGIVYVRGSGHDDLAYDLLFRSVVQPICTPALAAGPPVLATPDDLAAVPLLAVDGDDWPSWLDAAGLGDRIPRPAARFDSYLLAYEAALDGQGVALSCGPFTAADLAAGRLVAPFALTVQQRGSWYLVYPPGRSREPAIDRFRRWLQAEADATAL